MERPERIAWSDPRLRTYLYNLLDDPAGPFAHVDGDARVMLKAIAHYRNPVTGECGPGWDRLGQSTSQKRRAVGYTLARLGAAPSRQSDKRIVEGYGLVWREKRWRGARRTSSLHGFTCKFLILAGLLLSHECMGCRHMGASDAGTRVHPMHQNGRSIRDRSNRKGGEPGPHRSGGSPPLQRISITPQDTADEDPTWTAFERLFHARRHARYQDDEGGTLRPERRTELATALRALVAEGCAWAQARELPLTEDAVLAGLLGRLIELWLDWPGSTGVLRERRHPIGLLPGDLRTFAPRALAAWKRAVRPPKPPPAPDELPARTPLLDPAPQIASTAAPFAAAVVAAIGGGASVSPPRSAPPPVPPTAAPFAASVVAATGGVAVGAWTVDVALAPELAPVLAKKAELQKRGLWQEPKPPPPPPPLLGGVLEQLRAQAQNAAQAMRTRHASRATHATHAPNHAPAPASAPPSVEGCGACSASGPCDACATRHALLHPELFAAQRAERSGLTKTRRTRSAPAPERETPPIEAGGAEDAPGYCDACDARAEALLEDLGREHAPAAEPSRAPVPEEAPVLARDDALHVMSDEGAPHSSHESATNAAPTLASAPREEGTERAAPGAREQATHVTQATQAPTTEGDVIEVAAELWYERRREGRARDASGRSPGRSWVRPGPIARAERRRARRAEEAVLPPDEAGAAPSAVEEPAPVEDWPLPWPWRGPVERYERRRKRRGPLGGLS